MGRELAGGKIDPGAEAQAAQWASKPWRAIPVEQLAGLEAQLRDWPAQGRLRRALWLNVLAPGVGSILLQRPRQGLVVAVAFLLCAQVTLLGLLIMPLLLGPLVPLTAPLAGAVWLLGQILLRRRMQELQDPQLRLQASARIEQAHQAVAAALAAEAHAEPGEAAYVDALELLAEAAAHDDEQPDLNWLLARAQTAVFGSDKATPQWRRLDQVDKRGRFQAEIHQALSMTSPKRGRRQPDPSVELTSRDKPVRG